MKQFITEAEPDSNGRLILAGKDYRYLRKVRRIRERDRISVLLPGNRPADMITVLINDDKKVIHLQLHQATAVPDVPAPLPRSACSADIVLLQWILKGAKTDTIIRQATEAGVCMIVPVIGEFSIARKQNPAQMERYRRIIKEARQQSGSHIETVITEPAPLAEVLQNTVQPLIDTNTVCGMCTEVVGAAMGVHTFLAAQPARIIIAIGAEGGISLAEADMLAAAGFKTIHFDTNVLRAETAALYAIAAMQTIRNEANTWQSPVSIS